MPLFQMPVPRRRRNRANAARPRKSVPRVASSKALARTVNRIVKRAGETKYCAQFMTNADSAPVPIYGDVYPQGTPNGNVQLWQTLPIVNQGTGDFERIGTKINPTKLCADLDVKFNTDNAIAGLIDQVSWDVTVHVWYGIVKRFKAVPEVVANKPIIVSNMLEDGQGNLTRWLGGPSDQMFKTNSSYLTVKHKKFRMYRPLGIQNTGTNAGGATTYFPQTIAKRMRLYFKTPKALRYDEGQSYPEGYAPFVIIGYQNNDETQASNAYTTNPYTLATQVPALLATVKAHLFYKDG